MFDVEFIVFIVRIPYPPAGIVIPATGFLKTLFEKLTVLDPVLVAKIYTL